MNHKIPVEQYIIYSEAEQNVLPLGFLCHNRCIFCSHKNIDKNSYLNNFCLYKRSFDEITEHINFLDPSKKVIIGESATKIFEGEPFMRPDIIAILKKVRERIKTNIISITTCGAYFKEDFFENICDIAPIEINFSLNSFNAGVREKILPDGRSELTFTSLERICKVIENTKNTYSANNDINCNKIDFNTADAGINFTNQSRRGNITLTVSLMALNQILTPVDEIFNDIKNLRALQYLTLIKVYLPRFSNILFKDFFHSYEEFEKYCEEVIQKLKNINDSDNQTPVIIEPGTGTETGNSITGIIPQSRAALAKIKASDEIILINAVKPLTKSHCFELISKFKGDLNLKLKRKINENNCADGENLKTENHGIEDNYRINEERIEYDVKFKDFEGKTEGAGGLVFESDMSGYDLNKLMKSAELLRAENRKAIFLTSKLSFKYIQNLVKKFNLSDALIPIYSENEYFGGNIDCAGLLTLSDIEKTINKPGTCDLIKQGNINTIIIPEILLDHLDIDLEGNNFIEFQEKIPYKIIKF